MSVLSGSFGIRCDNATLWTETTCTYLEVPQVDFGKLQPTALADVALAVGIGV